MNSSELDTPGPSSAPAGWYANPDDQGQWRYWDGTQWTSHIAERVLPEDPSRWRSWDGEAWPEYTAARVEVEGAAAAQASEQEGTLSATSAGLSSDPAGEELSPADAVAESVLQSPLGLALPSPLDYGQPGGKGRGEGRWSRLMRGLDASEEIFEVMKYHNKCIYCGKRLKYAEYGVIIGTLERMKTCRACGRDQPEQPKMLDVIRSLRQPVKIFVEEGPLPLCKNCQVSVLIGVDSSYFFCRECLCQWPISSMTGIEGVNDVTDEMREWFPIPQDQSLVALSVQQHLTKLGLCDWTTALLIVADEATRTDGVYFRFVAVLRDRLEVCDVNVGVEHFDYRDLDVDACSVDIDASLRLAFCDGRSLQVLTEMDGFFIDYLAALRQVHDAASIPFGEQEESKAQSGSDALETLERLAALHKEGLLTSAEFTAQKEKLLGRI